MASLWRLVFGETQLPQKEIDGSSFLAAPFLNPDEGQGRRTGAQWIAKRRYGQAAMQR
jgi:hypothetical protein